MTGMMEQMGVLYVVTTVELLKWTVNHWLKLVKDEYLLEKMVVHCLQQLVLMRSLFINRYNDNTYILLFYTHHCFYPQEP